MLDKVPSILRRRSGVYILSQFSSPEVKDSSRVKIKVGSSKTSLYQKVDSYHTALPDSFWIFSCVITKNSKIAVELESHIKNGLELYRYKNYEYDERKFGEWYKLRKSQLREIMNNIIREKWEGIRGVFNYNPVHFSLAIPDDLNRYPKRTLYEGIPDTSVVCTRAGKPVRRKSKTRNTKVNRQQVLHTTSYNVRYIQSNKAKDLIEYNKEHYPELPRLRSHRKG